jgi:hypothetical protein
MGMTSEKIEIVVADPSIWAKEGTIGQSGAERMQETFQRLYEQKNALGRYTQSYPLLGADNARVVGWGQIRELMKTFPGPFGSPTSRLKIFKTCYHLIRTTPSMIYSDRNPEDLDTKQEDHAVDALRYGVMYLTRMNKSEPPKMGIERQIEELQRRSNIINPNQMYR